MLKGIETLKRGGARPRPCAVLVWLDTLSAEDRAQAEDVMADSQIQTRAIFKMFNENGAQIANDQSVGRHRRGDCCRELVAA